MTERNEGWRVDPEDATLMHWWDGQRWTGEVKPRLVLAAEDQTRIMQEQTRLLVEIRNNLSTIKVAVMFWFGLSLFGLVAYLIAVNNH